MDKMNSTDFLHLLMEPRSLDRIDTLIPEHRGRLFPPTKTLAMFLGQAISADGSSEPPQFSPERTAHPMFKAKGLRG
jgi:hypothetical protein